MVWCLYDKKNIYFLAFASEKCNSGGGIDISLNIRNKRADGNIFLTCLTGLYFFFFTFYSVFQKSTFDCEIINLTILSIFWSGNAVWRHRAFWRPNPTGRQQIFFFLSFLIRCKCAIVSAKYWHYSWPWGETINTMPLFDGLVSGGEKTAIVIDLGAAYTKWVPSVSIPFSTQPSD